MNRIHFIIILLVACAVGRISAQEIIIGTGTASSSSAAFSPIYTDSWWESTFLASEVNASGNILSISLQANGSAYACEEVNIYMGHRSGSDYSTSTSFTPASDLTLVYSGTSVTIGAVDGWEEFQFQTPFDYNGVDNLVVVFAKHATAYSNALKYNYTVLTSYPSIYRRADNNISYSQHPGSVSGTEIHWRPNIKLLLGNAACVQPAEVHVTDITENSCTFSWLASESGGYYNYQVKEQGDSWGDAAMQSTYDTMALLNNLTPSTHYDFRVQLDCGDTTSLWVEFPFTTLQVPAALPYSCDFNDTAENAMWLFTSPDFNRWAIGTATSYDNDGTDKAMYVSNDAMGYNYAADDIVGSYLFAERVFDFGETPGTYELSFDWKASGFVDGNNLYGGVALFLVDATVQTQAEFPGYMNEALSVGALLNDWSHVTVQLTDVSGYKKLQFFTWGYSFPEARAVPAAVDNILIQESGCVTPAMTFEPGVQSVTVTHDGSPSGEYYLLYRISGTSGMQDTTFTGSSVVLENLQMNTTYIAWIAQICGSDTSAFNNGSTFTTTCGTAVVTQSFPWTEPFSNVPACWDLESGIDAWAYNTNGYIRHGYGFYSCDAITPVIDISAVAIPCVKFDEQRPEYNNSGVADQLQVYYRTLTGYDTSAWVLLGTYTDVTNSFRTDSLLIPTNLALIQLKFTATGMGDDANGCSVDNVKVYNLGNAAACMAPIALNADNITAFSAELSWMLVSYGVVNLHYKSAAESAYTTVADVQTVNGPYLLENLNPGTEYQWYLTLLCNGDTVSTPLSSFFTDCGQLEIPYMQNFDSYEQFSIPQCWGRINSYIGYPQVCIGNAHSGSNALKFICNPSGFAPIYSVMPEFNAVFSELQVNFWTRRESANSGTLTVGYVTDPADASTFVPVMSVNSSQIGDDDYHNYLVKFDSVDVSDTTHYYITFKYEQTSTWYWFVDDIQVTLIPPCLEPESLAVGNLTISSAELTWTDVADLYVVYYKAEGDSLYSEVNGAVLTNGVYLLEELAAGTHYEWYVASICPDGTLAPSFTSGNFVTQCHALAQFPTTWDFESNLQGGTQSYPLPLCWSRISPVGPNAQYPYVTTNGNNAHSGTHSMVFYNMYSGAYGVLPEIDDNVLSVQDVQLTFYARTSFTSPATLEVGVMSDPTDPSTFTHVQSFSPATYYPAEAYEVTFFTYTGNGRYIAIRNVSPPDVTASFFLDDVTVDEAPACARPLNLVATSSSTNSVTLSWVAAPGQTEWEIAYGNFGFNPDITTQVVTATSNPFEVTGLSPATTYQFFVRAVCAPGEASAWSHPNSGSTGCGALSLPYSEDFESYMGTTFEDNHGIAPSCWTTFGTNSVYGAPHITSSGDYHYTSSGSNCMVFTSGSAGSESYAALPTFTQNLNTLTLTFWRAMESAYHGTLTVGYVTDLNNIPGTFVAVSMVPSVSPSGASTFVVDFVGVDAPAAGNICFRWSYYESYYSCCIDDINVTSSGAPVLCDVPTGLDTTMVANESIAITWGANGAVNGWNIRYRQQNGSWSYASTSTNSFTITGLSGLTTYEIQVQADCGNDDTSEWSGSLWVQTRNTGLENFPENSISLYPNPAGEVIHVQCTMYNVQSVEVIDVYGKVVRTPQYRATSPQTAQINVSGLAAGLYFVRVTTEDGMATKPFVKR